MRSNVARAAPWSLRMKCASAISSSARSRWARVARASRVTGDERLDRAGVLLLVEQLLAAPEVRLDRLRPDVGVRDRRPWRAPARSRSAREPSRPLARVASSASRSPSSSRSTSTTSVARRASPRRAVNAPAGEPRSAAPASSAAITASGSQPSSQPPIAIAFATRRRLRQPHERLVLEPAVAIDVEPQRCRPRRDHGEIGIEVAVGDRRARGATHVERAAAARTASAATKLPVPPGRRATRRSGPPPGRRRDRGCRRRRDRRARAR